jgi:hypothetical protein
MKPAAPVIMIGLRRGSLSAFDHDVDRVTQARQHAFFATCHDSGPRCLQQNIAYAGFTMQKYRKTAREGFYSGNPIPLYGRHQEQMRLGVSLLQLCVAYPPAKVHAWCDVQRCREFPESRNLISIADHIQRPMHARRQGMRSSLELRKRAQDPVDALVGFYS